MLLPPSSNTDYRGSPVAAWFLVLASVLTIIPGLIHYGLPDGGAGVIAHIDLSTRAETIIALFAWYGALQIPFGLLGLIIALRYRTLVPLMLLMMLLMQGLSAWSAWFGKGSCTGHHPPEHFASLGFLALGLVFFCLSLRTRGPAPGSPEPDR